MATAKRRKVTQTKKEKKSSEKRRKLGRKLARTLPRDEKGKFLPRGSKNLFRRKPKRTVGRTSGGKRRTKPTKRRSSSSVTMAKRRRTVKGVRRADEFANFIVFQAITDAALGNIFKTFRVATPLPRIKTFGNKATILEILWVEFALPTLSLNFDKDDVDTIFNAQLSIGAPPAGILPFSDPRVFAQVEISTSFLANVNGNTRLIMPISPVRYELQTMNGDGYLLTAEAFNLNIGIINHNTAFGVTVEIKVWYRFVDIPLQEFVGLVQSTQQQ